MNDFHLGAGDPSPRLHEIEIFGGRIRKFGDNGVIALGDKLFAQGAQEDFFAGPQLDVLADFRRGGSSNTSDIGREERRCT
ncbi:MAG TPA: hypothetical protein VMV19_15505 [Xanthobacteraceae bacterium]|nr:hypothetical protein [Xanthobacteraceae bacterium]